MKLAAIFITTLFAIADACNPECSGDCKQNPFFTLKPRASMTVQSELGSCGAGKVVQLTSVGLYTDDDDKLHVPSVSDGYKPIAGLDEPRCYHSIVPRSGYSSSDIDITVYCGNFLAACDFYVQTTYSCAVPQNTPSPTPTSTMSCFSDCSTHKSRCSTKCGGSMIQSCTSGTGGMSAFCKCGNGNSPSLGEPCKSSTPSPTLTPEPTTSPVPATPFTGKFERISVSPDICNQPSDCNYKCSASYTIEASADALSIHSTATETTDCKCAGLSATVNGDVATGVAPNDFTLTKTAKGIDVVATVSGVECTATYKASTQVNDSYQATASFMLTLGLVIGSMIFA